MGAWKTAVYGFSVGSGLDFVSRDVFDRSQGFFDLRETGLVLDDFPVLEFRNPQGHRFVYARTRTLMSYDFARYRPFLQEHFPEADFFGEVNWHEGAKAPDRIFSVHTVGDVTEGVFAPSDPGCFRALLRALEGHRLRGGLEDFSVVPEATHWSGTWHGGDHRDLARCPVPMVDIEIGSSPESFSHPGAQEVLARSLVEVFDPAPALPAVLCVGGVHFEGAFGAPALREAGGIGVGHILPNRWIVSGAYDGEDGGEKFRRAAESVRGGISALVYHEGIKAPLRDACRAFGQRWGVPVRGHKALRDPAAVESLGLPGAFLQGGPEKSGGENG